MMCNPGMLVTSTLDTSPFPIGLLRSAIRQDFARAITERQDKYHTGRPVAICMSNNDNDRYDA